MKRKFVYIISCLIISILVAWSCPSALVFASENHIIADTDYRLNSDYLDFYAVGREHFDVTNNGGEITGNELDKAFDRNFSTSFKSKQDNNVNYIENDETKSNFINTITITFSKKVTLDRIIYGTEKGITRGYPTQLNLYYKNDGEFVLLKNFTTQSTTSFVLFEFDKTEMSEFKFEYVEVEKAHKYQATAREILLLQPESKDYDIYQNLFTDYAETKLNSKINSYSKICEFENSLKNNINFSSQNEKIERAKSVAKKEIVFDQDFELSTKDKSQKQIKRYGDIASYCRNNLQMASFGTNRQSTGIWALAGDTVTVYVTAKDGDPLPKIRFSQHIGHWRSWLGGELSLSLGKNTFVVPNFYHDDYTQDAILGGPIYICNPYTTSEQSADVKVYIEGGKNYPVLTKDVSDKEFLVQLNSYVEKVNNDNYIDIAEIVTDHTILTLQVTEIAKLYANYSPQKAIENWNKYMDQLLEFGGITQDKNNPYFDEKNLHINCNIRVVQPWSGGWMYAAGEHIGIRTTAQTSAIYGSGLGWGITHEIGHSLDNPNRTVSETSNNMYSKFNETAIEQSNTRGEFSKTLATLSNDLKYNKNSYFLTTKYNYLVWWYIEAWQNGYWGKLENCYRGINPTLNSFLSNNPDAKDKLASLTPTELQVFYSSMVTGVDLSYYFERWGYTIKNDETDPVFARTSETDTFNQLMTSAIQQGFVDNSKEYKLWYQDCYQYHSTNKTPSYSAQTQVSIKNVAKTSTGYSILIDSQDCDNHLGYEIWVGDDDNGYNVIGFCYDSCFVDSSSYADGYTPKYKVVAVDNTFSNSSMSEAKTYEKSVTPVCKIGDTEYFSLADAIDGASDCDTIKLLTSINSVKIEIDKTLTITLDESVTDDITIFKVEMGSLFVINSGCTLKILATNHKIILDGNNFFQNGALVEVLGTVNAQNIEFKNNLSRANGGAIIIGNGSKNSSFANCVFSGNSAINGIIALENANSNVTLSNSNIFGNTATDGIIYNKGTITLNNCEIKSNFAHSVVKNYDGGVMYVNDCVVQDNTAQNHMDIDGYTIISSSEIGGEINFKTDVARRTLTINNSDISQINSNGVLTIDNCTIKKIIANKTATIKNSNIKSLTTFAELSLENSLVANLTIKENETTIKNNCEIEYIEIKQNSILVLDSGLFSNFSSCKFALDFDDKMQVMTAKNYQLTNDDVKKINLTNKNTNLQLEDNVVMAIYTAPQNTISIITILTIVFVLSVTISLLIYFIHKKHRIRRLQIHS